MVLSCFSSVQFSRSVVSDSVTPWIAACQASLSITNSWSSLRLMSIESVMPSSHLILCHPLLLLHPIPRSISLPMSQLFAWGGQSTGVSALASFLPKKSQGWSPSEWTGKSLQSCPTLGNPMDCSSPLGSSVHGDSPHKNTGVGCHALLHGIFLTQGSNPHLLRLLHWQTSPYLLSY